jgi:hypothetical protein
MQSLAVSGIWIRRRDVRREYQVVTHPHRVEAELIYDWVKTVGNWRPVLHGRESIGRDGPTGSVGLSQVRAQRVAGGWPGSSARAAATET